ncbi:MAG TPA: DUF427 domain-containing protein [Pseudomonadales bacterium]|nr:DUF427 domain-containing protein [Pseudomonadales bacterium]
MGQFRITPRRKHILAKIPDYAVTISPAGRRVTIACQDEVIAESDDALLVQETRHADVFYLPRADVNMALLSRTEHSTYCPFKGHASYWTLEVNGSKEENLAWSYENPDPEVAPLKDYLSFYTDRIRIR